MDLRKYISLIALIHLLVYLSIFLDIAIIRQIIVFAYLLFVPGFVFLGALRIGKISYFDLVLFSIGLSIALLMFTGLFVNMIFPFFGVSRPLTEIPILFATSTLTLGLFIFTIRYDISRIFNSISIGNIEFGTTIRAILLTLIPVVSVLIVLYLKAAIPILTAAIAMLFIISVLSSKLIPPKLYPLFIFAIALSLALQFTLMSQHITGSDSPLEYYVFKLTEIGGKWIPLNIGHFPQPAYNAMLSITILPTIFSVLMNINGEILFKIMYPIIFCLIPVTIYRILAKEHWKTAALVSTLFFLSSPLVFYGVEALSLNRQIVAELFFILSVLLLLERQFSTKNNRLILILLGSALAVSHYSLMIIFLIFLFSAYLFERLRGKRVDILPGGILLLLFGVAFSWYSLVPSGIITQISTLANHFISNFNADLLSPAARSSSIFASHSVLTIASPINWVLFISAHGLVLFGILAVLLNKQSIQLDRKYRAMVAMSSVLLLMAVAIPNLAPAINFTRFYEISFLFLSPCFIFGATFFLQQTTKLIKRGLKQNKNETGSKITKYAFILMAIFVSAYFLSQSGFVNHVVNASPLSYTMDWNRMMNSDDLQTKMGFYIFYTPEQDISGATWLSRLKSNNSTIYSDFTSRDHPISIYGLIPANEQITLTNYTRLTPNSYIYLRSFNVFTNYITPQSDWIFNAAQISPVLKGGNIIYNNGGSQVYAPP